MYVDNLTSGDSFREKAEQIKSTATEIFAHGTLELHKGHSNDQVLDSPSPSPYGEMYTKEQFSIPRKVSALLLRPT